jgi:hypothetical protein
MEKVDTSWRQHGRVYLWCYKAQPRRFHRWHLTAEDAACDSLARLFETLHSTRSPQPTSVVVSKPTPQILAVPNYRQGAKVISVERLNLSCVWDAQVDHWRLEQSGTTLTLELGQGRLWELSKGIADIKARRGDYSIGPRKSLQHLWFWWHPAELLRSRESRSLM